jgi:uncharacterized membrane protein YfcA
MNIEASLLVRAVGLGILGLAAGSLSGFLGIGGAVVIIPALVFIFGFSQMTAQGTTLMLMIPPIGLLAALQYWKAGHVDLVAGVIIAVFFFFGGLIGGRFADQVDPVILRKVFAVFLAVIAVKMFLD